MKKTEEKRLRRLADKELEEVMKPLRSAEAESSAAPARRRAGIKYVDATSPCAECEKAGQKCKEPVDNTSKVCSVCKSRKRSCSFAKPPVFEPKTKLDLKSGLDRALQKSLDRLLRGSDDMPEEMPVPCGSHSSKSQPSDSKHK